MPKRTVSTHNIIYIYNSLCNKHNNCHKFAEREREKERDQILYFLKELFDIFKITKKEKFYFIGI